MVAHTIKPRAAKAMPKAWEKAPIGGERVRQSMPTLLGNNLDELTDEASSSFDLLGSKGC